jgi:hypothetical protein
MIAQGGLLLVVSYLFAVLVLWVELEIKYITKLEFEKYFAGLILRIPLHYGVGL